MHAYFIRDYAQHIPYTDLIFPSATFGINENGTINTITPLVLCTTLYFLYNPQDESTLSVQTFNMM